MAPVKNSASFRIIRLLSRLRQTRKSCAQTGAILEILFHTDDSCFIDHDSDTHGSLMRGRNGLVYVCEYAEA